MGEARLLDVILFKRFVEALPAGMAEWVRCHWPASLDMSVSLAENHLAAQPV